MIRIDGKVNKKEMKPYLRQLIWLSELLGTCASWQIVFALLLEFVVQRTPGRQSAGFQNTLVLGLLYLLLVLTIKCNKI